jgi:F-type H+-transporting ATPase subunit delta
MISSHDYAEALYAAIQETDPKDHDKVLDNFAKILHEQGDIAKYPEIEEAFTEIEQREAGIMKVHVTTAHENADSESLIKGLNLAAGKKMDIDKSVDPSLIGGVIIRAGDMLIDASVSGEIRRLKEVISSGHEDGDTSITKAINQER